MKKCIISGMTAEQAQGSPRTGYPALSPGIQLIMEKLGYEVHLAPLRVETNEELLAQSDIAILGMSPIIAVGSRYLYGVLDAIAKARKNNCGLLFFISDWQTHLLVSSLKTILNGPHRLTKYFMHHRTDFLWAVHHADEMIRMVIALSERPWPGTLVPAHPWRNDMPYVVNNVPARRLYFFDPTAFTIDQWKPHSPQTPDELRNREWVMAALGDYSDWRDAQGFTWPVRTFGGKTMLDTDEGARTMNPRVHETEVHANYAECWGGLGPAHKMDGSGWWRTRWKACLNNGGIVHGSDAEMSLMGGPFYQTVQSIESLNTQGLIELQRAQVAAYQVESEESVLQTFAEAIAAARSEI